VQGWLIDPHSGLMSVEHHGGHFSRDGAHLDTSTGAAIAASIMEMITRAAVTKRMAGWSVSTSVGVMGLCAPAYGRDKMRKGSKTSEETIRAMVHFYMRAPQSSEHIRTQSDKGGSGDHPSAVIEAVRIAA
jgi:hypothetical protein